MEKLKITDLSIGDWVQAKQAKLDYDDPDLTPPMKIIAIDNREPKQAYVDLAFGDGVVAHSAFVEDLRPIPISIEILEKNEFVDNGVGQHYLKCGDGITIRVGRSPLFHDECWLVITDKDVGNTINTTCVLFNAMYVHHIQRAIRLAKVDKDITL